MQHREKNGGLQRKPITAIAGKLSDFRFATGFLPQALKEERRTDDEASSRSVRAPPTIHFRKYGADSTSKAFDGIWDGLPAHRSRVVINFFELLHGDIVLKRLPAYTPN